METLRKQILKVNESREHRVTNSLGVYDAYKYIRKNKWFNIGRPLKEHEFYSIIRRVNDLLADNLVSGTEIILPYRMGKLELRKKNAVIKVEDNGEIKTNLPIDWDRTLKLWCEDSQSLEKKTLVRVEEKELYRVFYNRLKCNYNNCSFYEFNVNRSIKRRLKKNIKEGIVDAYILNYGN